MCYLCISYVTVSRFFETKRIFFSVALAVSGTSFADQAGLKLINPHASASQVLELKAYATTTIRIFNCY